MFKGNLSRFKIYFKSIPVQNNCLYKKYVLKIFRLVLFRLTIIAARTYIKNTIFISFCELDELSVSFNAPWDSDAKMRSLYSQKLCKKNF